MIFMFSFLLSATVSVCLLYNFMLSAPDKKDNETILFEIKSGESSKEIATNLKKEGLIRNKNVFLFYVKINDIMDIKAGYFNLNKSMSVEQLLDTLRDPSALNTNGVSLLFKEGINMRSVANIISENTNNTAEDVFNKLADKEYISKLYEKYWFITDDIDNENIYYPLEGYLFPDTYIFENKDVSVEEIFKKMLDEEETILNKYKNEIENSNYSVHEILTLASMAEAEATSYEDKQNVISVFENRLNNNMNLGSDVTTYYAVKLDMNERDLMQSEINTYNPYNTRGPNMEGKLPVGPICNPSEQSIKAVLNKTSTDYLYFVADKNRKVYFTKSISEHDKIINELKEEGLWYEW